MTSSRDPVPPDPIDDWLGADIELLPPPPGAFERIHRTARRRRTIKAAVSVAGAVVIAAGAVTLPLLGGALLTGRTSGPARIDASGTANQPATGDRTGHPSPGHRPRPGPSAGVPPAGPPLTDTRSGPPVAGFRPTSVTFAGTSTGALVGAVIGQAGSCAAPSCTTVAGTADYGRSWHRVGAPPAGPPSGSSGVSQIRFLNEADGWAYGPALWATHDGGRTWRQVPLPGRVIDLSTVAGRAFAVVASCTGTGADYAAHCTSFALYSAAAHSGTWHPVPGAAASVPEAPGGLQLTGQRGYLLASGLLFTGPVTGAGWHSVTTRTSLTTCLTLAQRPSGRPGPALIAPAASSLFLACDKDTLGGTGGPPATRGPLMLYASPDGGQTWQARGVIAASGTARSLAVAPGGDLVLASTAGLYYSADARNWHPASLPGGAPPGGFSFVGMTTTTQGVAVPADPGLREIFVTLDGGRSWQQSFIR